MKLTRLTSPLPEILQESKARTKRTLRGIATFKRGKGLQPCKFMSHHPRSGGLFGDAVAESHMFLYALPTKLLAHQWAAVVLCLGWTEIAFLGKVSQQPYLELDIFFHINWVFPFYSFNFWIAIPFCLKKWFIDLFIYFEAWSHYVAMAGLQLLWRPDYPQTHKEIFPLPQECWNLRHGPPCWAKQFVFMTFQ